MARQSFDIRPRRGQFARIAITGHSSVLVGTRRARRVVDHWAMRLVLEEAKEVLKRALHYCPIKTGRLRSSGRVRRQAAGLRGRWIHTAEIRFGGARAPYAVRVHENLAARHSPPTRSKYLWQALMDRRRKALRRMGKRLQGAVR